jgi:hypothetical protein
MLPIDINEISFISDMNNNYVDNDDVTMSDDEGRRHEHVHTVAHEETSSDENINDDSDFYDFLESVSDRIDGITNQSKSSAHNDEHDCFPCSQRRCSF